MERYETTQRAMQEQGTRLVRPQGYGRATAARRYRAESARRVRRAQALRRAGLAVLVAAFVGAGAFAAVTLQGLLVPAASAEEAPAHASDARDTWRAGSVPRLYQNDPTWAGVPYAEAPFGETGCGPTCLAMVRIALTGNADCGPTDVAAYATAQGWATKDGTAWALMGEGAAHFGLEARQIAGSEQAVRRALAAGQPVICSMAPGDFTTTGHFIVLAGIDANGKLVIRDPNSPERTAQAWDFERVLPQCRALWAYTVQ